MKRVVIGLLVVALLASSNALQAAPASSPGLAPAGQAQRAGIGVAETVRLLGPVVLTDEVFDTALVSSSSGQDTARITGFFGADVFVTVEGIDGDEGLEWTPYLSVDREHWAPVTYEWWNGEQVAETVVGRKHEEDGTKFMMVKLAGDFLSVRGEATGTVTVTVSATHRFPG